MRAIVRSSTLSFSNNTFRTRLALLLLSSLEPNPSRRNSLQPKTLVIRQWTVVMVACAYAKAALSLIACSKWSLSLTRCSVASSSLSKNERFTNSKSLARALRVHLRVSILFFVAFRRSLRLHARACYNLHLRVVFCFFRLCSAYGYLYAWLYFRFIFALNWCYISLSHTLLQRFVLVDFSSVRSGSKIKLLSCVTHIRKVQQRIRKKQLQST